jgi:hypothetical protein
MLAILGLLLSAHSIAFAGPKPIETNEVAIASPPAWLTRRLVERTVGRIQRFLEWDIRKVRVEWFTDAGAFGKAHGFGDSVLAFSLRRDNSISVGPRVTSESFEAVFGHELVHVILYQKYAESIPRWTTRGSRRSLSGTCDRFRIPSRGLREAAERSPRAAPLRIRATITRPRPR